MATKSFGTTEIETVKRPHEELYELVGVEFPLSLTIDKSGSIIGASYDTTWKTGTTTPTEKYDRKTKETETVYEEDYEDHKLTAAQIKAIDGWLKENVTE